MREANLNILNSLEQLRQLISVFSIAFEMCPIHGSKELYLYDIAVHPNHQKQGIGTKLIELLREEAKARGVATIFVEAESEDAGAVAFYRKLGGEEVAVNHFNFNL
jgi:ribosomal protein S18 acetylase RimI-like enzyme